jgi:Uma2 family endonuclease
MGIEILRDTRAGRMSGTEFRAFQRTRRKHERWELIDGVPMMMVPPTIAHNHIAENFTRLLNDALARHDPARFATQRAGLELPPDNYKPEPDVAVIDANYEPGQRYIDRAYLLAEVISATDDVKVPGTNENWIDRKRDLYLAHDPCEAIVIVEQDRMAVHLDVKTAQGWHYRRLGPEDELVLPAFGLRCAVTDLYQGTPLKPRSTGG